MKTEFKASFGQKLGKTDFSDNHGHNKWNKCLWNWHFQNHKWFISCFSRVNGGRGFSPEIFVWSLEPSRLKILSRKGGKFIFAFSASLEASLYPPSRFFGFYCIRRLLQSLKELDFSWKFMKMLNIPNTFDHDCLKNFLLRFSPLRGVKIQFWPTKAKF